MPVTGQCFISRYAGYGYNDVIAQIKDIAGEAGTH
jgi:hypothetical protein